MLLNLDKRRVLLAEGNELPDIALFCTVQDTDEAQKRKKKKEHRRGSPFRPGSYLDDTSVPS